MDHKARDTLALLLLTLIASVFGASGVLDLNLLSAYDGAVCIDGSPAGYYIQPGTGADVDKYLIYMDGGGVCATPSDCYARSFTDLGSSKKWTSTLSGLSGYLSSGSNNFFSTWNIVFVKYCDGGRFGSDAAEPITYKNESLYFRGFTIMRSVVADLTANKGMDQAKKVVLTGCSAGGEGTYYLLDHIRALIPSQVDVHGIADAGWFLDINSVYGTPSAYLSALPGAFQMWNSSATVYPQCVSNFPGEEWKCLFASNLYPYLQTPIFILESETDTMQLAALYEFPCVSNFATCNSTELQWLEVFSNTMQQTMKPALASSRDGVFLAECPTHCQAVANSWFTTKIGGVSPAQAFEAWYVNGTSSKHVDTCQYPCNHSCS